MVQRVWTAGLVVAMASCGQPTSRVANDNETPVREPATPAVESAAAERPAPAPIDDKSVAGAVAVVERYAALLEDRRFAEARGLWSDGGRASWLTEAEFVTTHDKYAEIHAEVGQPGRMEGAAGSIYVEIPFRIHGTLRSGKPFQLAGPLSLRRVNDVPGSTAEQRRWHIARSELQPAR